MIHVYFTFVDKSIVLSTHKRIQKDNQQNEKNLLEKNDHNKIDTKVTKFSNIIPHTNIIALPEQDKVRNQIKTKIFLFNVDISIFNVYADVKNPIIDKFPSEFDIHKYL